MPLLEPSLAAMVLGSTISVFTATTVSEVSSYRRNPRKSAANSGWIPWFGYSSPYMSYSVYQSFSPSSVITKLQICLILCFLGYSPPLFYYIYDLMWHRVISPLVLFKNAPSYQTEEIIVPNEVSCWTHSNLLMCSGSSDV